MTRHITKFREGFPFGSTRITTVRDPKDNTGIAFTIIKLKAGDSIDLTSSMEMACLQMNGEIRVRLENIFENRRDSLFDEQPFAFHVCANTPVHLDAVADCEIAKFETPNDLSFPSMVYSSNDTEDEHRGNECCLRFVRTIFDGSNSHPNTQLVLGEVINFPGRWSSYPPHHHPQPEIYHYRFTKPKGYGHAELGEDVCKVRHYDTIKILDELDHAQCSAPGYGMYYIWVIRHLPKNRYTVPIFTEDHRWTMDPAATYWSPLS